MVSFANRLNFSGCCAVAAALSSAITVSVASAEETSPAAAAPPAQLTAPLTRAQKYQRALDLKERMEKALADEFQGDLPNYDALTLQGLQSKSPEPVSASPVEGTKDTVLLIIPGPVFDVLRKQWGDTVAVSRLQNGWHQIFLATPDNPARRTKLAADISAVMGRTYTIPAGTDRLLISPGP